MGQASVFSLGTQCVLGQLKTALEETRGQERRMVPSFHHCCSHWATWAVSITFDARVWA